MKLPLAAIFDMDGLLIDSEPLWRLAEQQVFRSVGLDLSLDQFAETMGLRIDEVVALWYHRHPWEDKSQEAVAEEILRYVEDLVRERGKALPGVYSCLEQLQEGGVALALATSSPSPLMEAVLVTLDLSETFSVRCSATEEWAGKPAPDVYFSAAKGLGISPEDCVVFEDSPVGLQAGRAAGMRVVAVPAAENFHHPSFTAAHLLLSSLEEFSLPRLAAAWSRPHSLSGPGGGP